MGVQGNSAPTQVVPETLKSGLPGFLLGTIEDPAFKKIFAGKIDFYKLPGIRPSA